MPPETICVDQIADFPASDAGKNSVAVEDARHPSDNQVLRLQIPAQAAAM